MKEMIVKKFFVVVMIVMVMMTCAACSKKGICDECGQEAKLTKYVVQGGMGNAGNAGETEYLCDDCLRMRKMFGY